MNRTLNIAFTGAYEIANYGDHLFPLVFKYELDKCNINYNLFLFSVFNGNQAFDKKTPVYSLEDMESLHQQYHFDVIIVGGGELIHLSSCKQLLSYDSVEYVNYRIFETWTIPSMMGLKYNIPVLWNAPGGQYNFPDSFHKLIKLLCRPVSYLSVRNYTTRDSLVNCGIPYEQITHVPDTAFEINKVYSPEFLLPIKNSILDFKDSYIVFHANRHIADENIQSIVSCLDSYCDSGYKIVLLPLAYTHNDQDILNTISNHSKYSYITFNKMLSLEETISILAFSELYVGISFHGAVTSIAYNRRAIIYDYIGSEKSIDLFKLVGKPDCYINDITKLPTKIKEVLSQKPNYRLNDLDIQLEKHFDKIISFISGLPATNNTHDFSEFSEFIETITKDTFDNLFVISNNEKIINEAKEFINKQASDYTKLKEFSDKQASDYARLKEFSDKQASDYYTLEKQLTKLQNENNELMNSLNIINSKYNKTLIGTLSRICNKLKSKFN